MTYPNPQNTFVTNFNADNQQENVELMTDEKGHLYPLSHIVDGNVLGDAFAVTPTNPASMYVNIAAGYIQVPFASEDYAYHCWMDEPLSLRIEGAHGSLPRRSYVIAYIDRQISYTESVTNNPALLSIIEVQGTPGASAPVPSSAQITSAMGGVNNPYVILAVVYVPAGANSLTVSNITDARGKLTLKNGIALPADTAAGALYPAGTTDVNSATPLKVAVIGPNDVLPQPDATSDILIIRLSE